MDRRGWSDGDSTDGDGLQVLLRPPRPILIVHIAPRRARGGECGNERLAGPFAIELRGKENRQRAAVIFDGGGRAIVHDGEQEVAIDAGDV